MYIEQVTTMNRTLTYQITPSEDSLRIEQYLRRRGFSRQNLTDLKNMPDSVLVNGNWQRMTARLHTGDTLTIHIRELVSSENIPPVRLPLDIVYEDEDILVVNKPSEFPKVKDTTSIPR